MYNSFIWQLPTEYQAKNIRTQLSWDGQIYYACNNCGWEFKIDPLFIKGLSEDKHIDLKCTQCDTAGLNLVRHLEHRVNSCKDCNQESEIKVTLFDEPKCPYCLSINLETQSSSINPAFPTCFGDYPYRHIWGKSEEEDIKAIFQQTQSLNFLPEFPLYLLLSIALCKRLSLCNDYNNQRKFKFLLNAEGLWLRDYFQRTGEIAAGIESVNILEECVSLIEDPLDSVFIEYNLVISIYSLLAKYPEEIVSLLANRPQIRLNAIKIAKKALKTTETLYTKGSLNIQYIYNLQTSEAEGRIELAKFNFIIGDILKVGEATQDQLQESVEYLNQAEEYLRQVSPHTYFIKRLVFGIRASRGLAISLFNNKSKEQIEKAIKDLKYVLSFQENDRAWSDKILSLYYLANLYLEIGQDNQAKTSLEKAMAIALDEINSAFQNEQILLQKTNLYINIFESLARYYVKINRAEKALNILESIKLASLRLSTLSATDKAKRQKKSAQSVAKAFLALKIFGQAQHTKIKKPQLQSAAPDLKKLVVYLNDVPTALLSFINDGLNFTVIAVIPSKIFTYRIYGKQWNTEVHSLEEMQKMMVLLEPSPVREKRLKRLCCAGYDTFLKPLTSFLETNQIQRICISAKPGLGSLPFEAFFDESISSDNHSKYQFDVFYLPSLSLGFDLLNLAPRRSDSRLLVIGYLGEDIRYTKQELDYITKLWGDRVTRLDGSQCTKKSVLNELKGDYDYIHFSCHGTFNPIEPLKSALHLVPNPERDSHRIMASDMATIKFKHAPVITMSACSSVLTSIAAASDCIGLTGSLFRAGARAIIGSRWPVYDYTAAIFTENLYNKFYNLENSPYISFCKVQSEMQLNYGIEDWAAFAYLGLP
ncbi:CHAT domain-containing protein [Aulosira sp. FACHB-615]|uniref:CHAT domain-containing protein n=1 Tax=Aulosira sp. FACHB-615 TaxID=2692777 RepID=UPI0016827A1A|nr:CHAT domain-containing protein [Aulosira sp. FACHB-615]MBD2491975.1 CHAT domain-containing protein [Aulosira sp. FACHB-615]